MATTGAVILPGKRVHNPFLGFHPLTVRGVEHSTRTTQYPQPSAVAVRRTVPRPAARGVVRPKPQPRTHPRSRHRPRPRLRLTGLGCGVLYAVAMVAVAWLCEMFGGAPALYGVLFVIAAVAAALWVRPGDLICAPIAAPLAFTLGLVTTCGLMDTVTELALRAPWLFSGTGTAAGLALLRKGLLLLGEVLKRRRRHRREAAR
jgi:hypothetical protein